MNDKYIATNKITKYLKKVISTYDNIDMTIFDLIQRIGDEQNYIDIYADASSIWNGEKRVCGIGIFFGDGDNRNLGVNLNEDYCKNINIIENIYNIGNNEAEIIACIEALKIVENTHSYVNIISDSRLVIDAMNGNCSKKKYRNLFNKLDELNEKFIAVNWIHTKGHSYTASKAGIHTEVNEQNKNYSYGNDQADGLSRLNI